MNWFTLRFLILITLILSFDTFLYSQSVISTLTLQEAIQIAQKQSPDAMIAKQQFKESFWDYRAFRSQYLPQLNLNTTVPNISRNYTLIYNANDTSQYFVPQETNRFDGTLSLNQAIGFSGGSISLMSNLIRLDDYLHSPPSLNYNSTPINIVFDQPLFKYNSYKWDRKIKPMQYDKAKRKYLEDVEQISINTANYFFDLLQAQIRSKIAGINLENNDTLYQIGQGRYKMGKIAENELYTMELNTLNAQAEVENAKISLDNALFRLKSYLRLKDDTIPIRLIPPVITEFFRVDPLKAVELANINSSKVLDFSTQLLEADREVNQTKMDGRFDANIHAEYGLTQEANSLYDVYHNPKDNEILRLSLNIPIMDWGYARSFIKKAESKREVVRYQVEQDRIDFQRSIYLFVAQFNIQKKQLFIAAKADTVAEKTYAVTKGRYLIGKNVAINDLNIAQIAMDNAKVSFYDALKTYWVTYFQIRKQTLFDFQYNETLKFNFDFLK